MSVKYRYLNNYSLLRIISNRVQAYNILYCVKCLADNNALSLHVGLRVWTFELLSTLINIHLYTPNMKL